MIRAGCDPDGAGRPHVMATMGPPNLPSVVIRAWVGGTVEAPRLHPSCSNKHPNACDIYSASCNKALCLWAEAQLLV